MVRFYTGTMPYLVYHETVTKLPLCLAHKKKMNILEDAFYVMYSNHKVIRNTHRPSVQFGVVIQIKYLIFRKLF